MTSMGQVGAVAHMDIVLRGVPPALLEQDGCPHGTQEQLT